MGLSCFGGLKLCSCFLGGSDKGHWVFRDPLLGRLCRALSHACVDTTSPAPDFPQSLRDATQSRETGHLNGELQLFSFLFS